ncbi:MAG: heme-binding domain-containing protein [Crocinitomicaceae bacterium]|nr:heme-binding domain-containing protein [Crocinitomicaceae bacterium]
MRKGRFLKKTGLILLIILVILQFIPVDRSVSKVLAGDDFIAMTKPTEKIEELLRANCYDCHSVETKHPWYSNVAPLSWWIAHHVEEGREELNFSNWGKMSSEKQDHKLEECAEEVEEGKMPLKSYTLTHGSLSDDEKEILEDWFESLRE